MKSNDRGVIIAKRSISLTKSYPIIGAFLALMGLLLSVVPGLVQNIPATGTPSNIGATNITQSVDVMNGLPFLAVPLQAFAAIIFATPVLLLFVYDKNNGVLEYFLSLGMNQRDVHRQYLKAALFLSLTIIVSEVVMDVLAGLIQGTGIVMLEISGLVVTLSLSVVTFGTLIMISFSSLQKQRVGSNQPLGMAIGVFVVMPSYVVPLIIPNLAFEVDLLLATVIVGLSALTYSMSGRLISREKLLP